MENEGKKYELIAEEFANMRDSFYMEKKYLDIFVGHLKRNSMFLMSGVVQVIQ